MERYCKVCFEKIKFSFLRNMIESKYSICSSCQEKIKVDFSSIKVDGVKIKFLSLYDGLLKNMLLSYKESNDFELRDSILYFFLPYIKLYSLNYIFVPIPSSKENNSKRGFNHLVEILKVHKLKYVDALENVSTKNQKELAANKRMNNKNIVINKNAYQLQDKKIILFDDVYTTGSTFISSVNTIKKISPKKIKGLIIMKNQFQIN